jgi:hypothetical protein
MNSPSPISSGQDHSNDGRAHTRIAISTPETRTAEWLLDNDTILSSPCTTGHTQLGATFAEPNMHTQLDGQKRPSLLSQLSVPAHLPNGEGLCQANETSGVIEPPSHDDRTALEIMRTSASKALHQCSVALHANLAQTAFGVMISSMCCAAMALSVLAFQAASTWSQVSTSASGRQAMWPDGTVAADVMIDGDPRALFGGGYNRNKSASIFRVGVGSKYQRTGSSVQTVWQQAVMPARPDAWIWAGNVVYADEPLFDCTSPNNVNHLQCICPASESTQAVCLNATLARTHTQGNVLLGVPGYVDFLDYMCGGFFSAYGAVPPGSQAAICSRPVLGVYGTHDSFGVLSDRTTPGKDALKNAYLDLLGESGSSLRRRSGRGAFERVRIYEDQGNGQAMDVYLLDEHYDRAPLPCAFARDVCSVSPRNQTVCF